MKRNNDGRGRRHRKKKKNPLLYLPHELITQILLRLPVKSLIRFKCVCKSWFSVISDPHFANSHFQLTATTPTRRILFISLPDHQTPLSVDIEASFHDDSASASLNLDFLLPKSYYDFEIKGSCRGFVVLQHYYYYYSSKLYLWNPSTGLHKQIPLSPLGSNLRDEHFYGLGYDESTDDIHFPYDYVGFHCDPMDCGLWVFGEFLSLCVMNHYNSTAEIWVMKEYKINSSWTKTLILPVHDFPNQYFLALCCTKNGDIIGTDGGTGLVKYDDNGQLLEHSSIDRDSCGGSQVAMYTPSLLSLPGDNEQA